MNHGPKHLLFELVHSSLYSKCIEYGECVCVCERVLCMGWIQVAKIQSKREQNIEREKPVLQILRTSNYTYIDSTEPRIG